MLFLWVVLAMCMNLRQNMFEETDAVVVVSRNFVSLADNPDFFDIFLGRGT